MLPDKKPYIHSFAKQYLSERKTEIYQGDKQILYYKGYPNYDAEYPLTGFFVGELEEEKVDYEQIKKYQSLKEIGFYLRKIDVPPNEKAFGRQRLRLILSRYEEDVEDEDGYMSYLPKDHQVLYDPIKKRAILLGRNAGKDVRHQGIGDWIYLNPTRMKNPNKAYSLDDYQRDSYNKMFDEQYERSLGMPIEKDVFVRVDELPVMITESREIICLPTDLRDAPNIMISGKKGSGKTTLAHGIIDRGKSKTDILFCHMNDPQGETNTWSLPNNKDKFELQVLNEKPMPLPMVYLHPTTDIDYHKVYPLEVGFEISLPFNDMIYHPEKYADLKASGKYFEILRDEIAEIKDADEIDSVLNGVQDLPKESRRLLKNYIDLIYKRKLTDKNGSPSTWKIKREKTEFEYNPILACGLAGLVSSLQTGSIQTIKFFPEYYRYFAEDIFEKQKNEPLFVNNKLRIWMFLDEVLSVANRKKSTVAEEILTRIVTEGRIRRIGTIMAGHEISLLPKRILDNITYYFSFLNPGEASFIALHCGLSDRYRDIIRSKLRTGECIAYADPDTYFIVYDKFGNRTKENGPYRGVILPTLSYHKPPGWVERYPQEAE